MGSSSPGNRLSAILLAAASLAGLTLISFRTGLAQSTWNTILTFIALEGRPVQASPPVLSQHEIAALDGMLPQQQAERLLERSINHYEGALDLVAKRVDGWNGLLNFTPQMEALLTSAYNSNDLRVRAAAIEISLAEYKVTKNRESVEAQEELAAPGHDRRVNAVWILGLLGNRGIETDRVLQTLLRYSRDSDIEVRHWAVEALALLGTDSTIEPLLEIFHNDPSPVVSERAACSLAQSGMLQPQQRMRAVPVLLTDLADPAFDAQRRQWTQQALRDITGKDFGPDATAWRVWFDAQPSPPPSVVK
jgi:hypothetical protein